MTWAAHRSLAGMDDAPTWRSSINATELGMAINNVKNNSPELLDP